MSPPAGPGESDLRLVSTRHSSILDALRVRGQVRAVQLAEEFGVSHETIRKDLLTLESSRLLRRVHGGALPLDSLSAELALSERTTMLAEKQRIAAAAIEFLPAAGAVLIDSGSTTSALVEALPRGLALVVITNSLPIALELTASHPELAVHVLGGQVRAATTATADAWTQQALREVRADVAFLGTNACSLEHGLSTPDASEAAVKAQMLSSARLSVLLADHTKFGREAVFRYGGLEAVDVVVTDTGMSPADARRLTVHAGIEVLRV